MAEPHGPCYGGWNAADLSDCWRIDFNIHIFTHGTIACTILPVYTADGPAASASRGHHTFSNGKLVRTIRQAPASRGAWCASSTHDSSHLASAGDDTLASLLTVVITTSYVKSHPSTRMLRECLASLQVHGGVGECAQLIMCDGFKLRKRSQPKVGTLTDAQAREYYAYVREVSALCRSHPALHKTRLVRLARHQGSAYAIREALDHVTTPLVLVVPHDCILARNVTEGLCSVAMAMASNPSELNYVKLLGVSTLKYAESARSQHGLDLRPTRRFGPPLLPMIRYMDNMALVSCEFLRRNVFDSRASPVRRGTFIEDTYGKQLQMGAWLASEACRMRLPPENGCYLYDDGLETPMVRCESVSVCLSLSHTPLSPLSRAI